MFAGAAQQREVIAHLLFQTKLALEMQRLNLSAINQIMGKIGYGWQWLKVEFEIGHPTGSTRL